MQLPGMLRQFSDSVRGAQHQWQGDVMHFSFAVNLVGRFQGMLQVTEAEYVLNVPFKLMERKFEGRARTAVKGWLDENLPN